MLVRSLLLCLGLVTVSGVFAATAPPPAASSATTALHITYKVTEKLAKCPVGAHPRGGCVWLTGNARESGARWPEMRRLAIVDAPAPGLPAGCDTATSSGVLYGKHGNVHFNGKGYYCPKTDTALYRYTLDAAQAKRHDLPVHGTIRYTGSSNTETFASSAQ